jgi:hypothetical protein
MTDWLHIILHPDRRLGLPQTEIHRFQIFAAVACDFLWFTRNKAYHDGLIPYALATSTTINKLALEHFSAWKQHNNLSPEAWERPVPPYFKINYDTTIRPSFSAQVAVCRSSTGSIIGCISLSSPPCAALIDEATAALLATRLSILLGLFSFILEGDSLTVTTALQHPDITTDWRISSTISSILSLIPPTASWKARHVNQSANFCAQHVASWAATRSHSGCIPIISPFSTSFPFCNVKDSPSTFFVP